MWHQHSGHRLANNNQPGNTDSEQSLNVCQTSQFLNFRKFMEHKDSIMIDPYGRGTWLGRVEHFFFRKMSTH